MTKPSESLTTSTPFESLMLNSPSCMVFPDKNSLRNFLVEEPRSIALSAFGISENLISPNSALIRLRPLSESNEFCSTYAESTKFLEVLCPVMNLI